MTFLAENGAFSVRIDKCNILFLDKTGVARYDEAIKNKGGHTVMVGKNIGKARKQAGMTQEELAEKLNVTRQAVSSWERERTEPDLDTLTRAAELLNVTPEELIYGARQQEKKVQWSVKAGESTVTLGTVLAVVISYVKWKSIGWAVLHGVCSWGYVIYYIIRYGWHG